MMQIEHYWPIEILEQVFPNRFGPNAGKGAAEGVREGAVGGRLYTVEPVKGGCSVIRLAPEWRPCPDRPSKRRAVSQRQSAAANLMRWLKAA